MTSLHQVCPDKQENINQAVNTLRQIWESDSMEPTIDFGDEINIEQTTKIDGDGLYVMSLSREHINPANIRSSCAPLFTVMRRVERLENGEIKLTPDNPLYGNGEIVKEADLADWKIIGKATVFKRNGKGFHTISGIKFSPANFHDKEVLV